MHTNHHNDSELFPRAGRHALLWLVAAFLMTGCGYPEVSPKAYEISKALYSAASRKSEEQLERAAQLIRTELQAAEISDAEAEWLNEVVTAAREGNWSEAQATARRIMEDQIDR